MPTRLRHVVVLVLAVLLTAGACGGDDGGGSIDLADSFASAAVCNGEPSDVNPPSSSAGFSAYVYLNDGDGWQTGWFDTFGDDHALTGDDAQSILCVTVAESSEGERCIYEDEDDSFELVMMNAGYRFELRNADTATLIGRGTGSASAEDCPLITSWTPGEGERRSWPVPTDGDLDGLVATFSS